MSVNVGLIDSGVNPWHSHVQGVEGGIAFHLGPKGEVVHDSDFRDEIGHGTALAGIIREKVPRVKLHAIKIFHRTLEAPLPLLFAALEWAIKQNFNVINLSLGTERKQARARLRTLCQQAYDQGIVIVAAAQAPDHQVFPSVFETVIGVYWNHSCDRDSLIYHPGSLIEFGAYGRPRDLPHMPPLMNFSGSSFATAYVTAKVVQLLEGNPGAGVSGVKEALQKGAISVPFPADDQ